MDVTWHNWSRFCDILSCWEFIQCILPFQSWEITITILVNKLSDEREVAKGKVTKRRKPSTISVVWHTVSMLWRGIQMHLSIYGEERDPVTQEQSMSIDTIGPGLERCDLSGSHKVSSRIRGHVLRSHPVQRIVLFSRATSSRQLPVLLSNVQSVVTSTYRGQGCLIKGSPYIYYISLI